MEGTGDRDADLLLWTHAAWVPTFSQERITELWKWGVTAIMTNSAGRDSQNVLLQVTPQMEHAVDYIFICYSLFCIPQPYGLGSVRAGTISPWVTTIFSTNESV